MSGPGQRPGQQDWIWSDGLQDHYRRHPNTGQYYIWNRGNPIPVPTTATQEPRSERQISRSHVLDISQPSRAGSPPDEATANFLHRGYPQTQQITASRSSSQSGGPTSTHSTSPPSSTFIASRSNTIRRSDTSQTSRQAQGVRDSNTYSPQAPSFVPRAPSSGGIQSRLDQGISQLSIRPDDVRSGSTVSGSAQSAEYVNEESGVRSIVRSGNVITDQSLRQDNITIHKHLSGTDGQKEVLYPEFRRRSKPRNFFTVGKVFTILWAEPAGDSAKSNTLITSHQQSTYPGRFGELVFSKVRRFIVIRESDGYCSALSIVSYGSQGAGKSGVIKHEHGIVYTGRQVPQPTPDELPRRGEGAMVPTAVRVDPDQPTEKLTPMSRINYGRSTLLSIM